MEVRGTKNLYGDNARVVLDSVTRLRYLVEPLGFEPFIPSSLQYKSLFAKQIGDNRMYEFKDRSDRELCLIPEVTAVALEQRISEPNTPGKIWYATRCYRYDKPQKGRYREFWQFGVECFDEEYNTEDMFLLAGKALRRFGLDVPQIELRNNVERGQGYYIGQGFEYWDTKNKLQLVGGGCYNGGIGFALGIERCLLAANPAEPGKE